MKLEREIELFANNSSAWTALALLAASEGTADLSRSRRRGAPPLSRRSPLEIRLLRGAGVELSAPHALSNLGSTAAKIGLTAEARDALERFVATAPEPQYRAETLSARRLLSGLRKPS